MASGSLSAMFSRRSTAYIATFRARMIGDDAFRFRLTYEDLSSPVLQSHIHFAQKSVNGAIAVFLCSNLGNGPAGASKHPPRRAAPPVKGSAKL